MDSAPSSAGPTSLTGGTSSEPASGECPVTMLEHRLSTVGLITVKMAQQRRPRRPALVRTTWKPLRWPALVHTMGKPPRRRRPPPCTSTHVPLQLISGRVSEWVLVGMAHTCALRILIYPLVTCETRVKQTKTINTCINLWASNTRSHTQSVFSIPENPSQASQAGLVALHRWSFI